MWLQAKDYHQNGVYHVIWLNWIGETKTRLNSFIDASFLSHGFWFIRIFQWKSIENHFCFRFFTVAMESTTILGGIFGLVALMLIFLLYANRRWCFHTTPAFACCDENSLPSKYVHKMGKLFGMFLNGNSVIVRAKHLFMNIVWNMNWCVKFALHRG